MSFISVSYTHLDVYKRQDGKTFEDNALIKARAIAAHTDAIVLADDSGLEIDYLPDYILT